jgi:hypothetical protein
VQAYAILAEHIDMRAQQVFEILPQPYEIEQAASRFHLDEEVNVAGESVTSGCRAEHSDVAGAVARGASQDFLASTTQAIKIDPDW